MVIDSKMIKLYVLLMRNQVAEDVRIRRFNRGLLLFTPLRPRLGRRLGVFGERVLWVRHLLLGAGCGTLLRRRDRSRFRALPSTALRILRRLLRRGAVLGTGTPPLLLLAPRDPCGKLRADPLMSSCQRLNKLTKCHIIITSTWKHPMTYM